MAQRPTLTTRGVTALGLTPVCAVAGVLLGAEELVLLSIALLSLIVTGLVQSAHRADRARGNWRVTVALTASDAEVGSPLDLGVTLVTAGHGGDMPTWLEDPLHCWERRRAGQPDAPRPRLPNPSMALRVPPLESGATARYLFPAPTAARGVYVLRGMRLWCLDSFGLVAHQVAIGPSATITVHPAPVAVELSDELLRGERGAEDNHEAAPLAHPRRDSSGDFSGIRSYVPGDRLRLLYWPALARTGELMVRDFEDSGPHRVHLVADVRALLGEPGCERVLAAVAGLGLRVLAQGSVVELSTTTGERIAVGPGPLGELALLRAIAAIETAPWPVPPRWRRGGRLAPPRRTGARTLPPLVGAPLAATPLAGTPLMVTTAEGASAMPGAFGFAHLVIAP
jgi:uncharacterized protein (DUF58 family)